jgi:uncharacterized protein DUF1549/uncharacterized protein DUF1553
MKWCYGFVAALVLSSSYVAGDRPVLTRSGQRPEPAALAATIDRRIMARLQENKVIPAPPADDATFFRRINLALGGRVPVSSEVRAFLADSDPNKREKAVEKLLGSAAFVNYQTTTWRSWLLPEAQTSPEVAATVPNFEAWLRSRIRSDVPYDRFVTELLTAPLDGVRGAGRMHEDDPEVANGALTFYTAKEGKPENLAAATARLFLGVRLECAQCHDHPFARWSRDQFWGLAAFYGGVTRSGGALREVFDRRELPVPNRDRAVPATFLDGKEPEWRFKKSPRVTLAAWVTAADNPFFARAAVNRLWGLMFGVGIIEPVDDAHEKNPPSHPELLDDLARAFVESGFDAKFILRAIYRSETYGRSSSTDGTGQRDVRLFARYPVQGLTPEQMFDSLQVVAGNGRDESGGNYLGNPGSPRRQFVETFALSGSRTDTQTTIIQALTLMNGGLVGMATSLEGSRTLGAVLELPGLTPAERVEALYLAALGRPPRPEELRRTLRHVEAGGSAGARAGYADVLWALLNGVEFRTNH